MSFQLTAISPEGRPIQIGFGQERAEYALEDRDVLREAYDRHKTLGWNVEVRDSDGRVVEWSDVETSVTAGDAA